MNSNHYSRKASRSYTWIKVKAVLITLLIHLLLLVGILMTGNKDWQQQLHNEMKHWSEKMFKENIQP